MANLKSSSTDSTIRQTFTKIGPLALLPINDHELTMIWSIDDKSAYIFLQKEKKEFIAEINNHFGETFDDLVFSTEIQHFPLNHLSAKTFAKNGIFLIGDAAHQIHPLAGLGLNAGLGDVKCLSEAINDFGKLELKKLLRFTTEKEFQLIWRLQQAWKLLKEALKPRIYG